MAIEDHYRGFDIAYPDVDGYRVVTNEDGDVWEVEGTIEWVYRWIDEHHDTARHGLRFK